jgi:hypothetical protein
MLALARGQAAAVLHVYIEGDGAAWPSPLHPPRDPTPDRPVALALAAQSEGSRLRTLALSRCRVGDAGASALGKALSSAHCQLKSLDLGLNGVGDDGASAVGAALACFGLRISLLLFFWPLAMAVLPARLAADPLLGS